jgi:tripartite-type tricarboxylate transporter receptor subunit TctC
MRRIVILSVALIMVLTTFIGCGKSAEEKGEDFYNGKTVTLVIPYRAGGGTDTQGRVLARYLEEYGNFKVEVENKDAAGGMEAHNYMYDAAEKDGLTICFTEISALWASDLTDDPTAQYDADKFTYIFTHFSTPHVFWIDSKLPINNVDDLKNTADLKLGIGGSVTSAGGLSYAVTIEALGLDAELIPGYRGSSECELALEKGEVNAVAFPHGGMVKYEEAGTVRALFTMAKDRDYVHDEVPVLGDLVNLSEEHKKMLDAAVGVRGAKGAFMPPGVPEDRVAYLDQVVRQIEANPEYQKEIEELAGEWLGYNYGNDVTEYIKSLSDLGNIWSDLVALANKYSAAK